MPLFFFDTSALVKSSLQLAVLLSIRNSNPTLVASDKALEQATSAEGINIINPEGR